MSANAEIILPNTTEEEQAKLAVLDAFRLAKSVVSEPQQTNKVLRLQVIDFVNLPRKENGEVDWIKSQDKLTAIRSDRAFAIMDKVFGETTCCPDCRKGIASVSFPQP